MLSPQTQRLRATATLGPLRRVAILRERGRSSRIATLAVAHAFETLGIAVTSIPASSPHQALQIPDEVIDLLVTLDARPTHRAVRTAWTLDVPLATIGTLATAPALAEHLASHRLRPRPIIEFSAPGGTRRCAAGRLELRSSEALTVTTGGFGPHDTLACHTITWSCNDQPAKHQPAILGAMTLETDTGTRTIELAADTFAIVTGLQAGSTMTAIDGKPEPWRHSDTLRIIIAPTRVHVLEALREW